MNGNTPQLEDGYTKIANKILEKLATINLSSYQSRILFFIFRKTYGFNKKEDWISNSQIVIGTGIHKAHVSRTKKELIIRKLVASNGNKITFQKNSRLWCELPKQVTVTSTGNKVTSTGTRVTSTGQKLPLQADTKDNIQKTIYTKYNSNQLLGMFECVNPSYEQLYKNKTQRACLDRLVNKYGEDWVYGFIQKLPAIVKMPTAPRITTPYELESKLGQLKIFLLQQQGRNPRQGVIKV